MAHSSKRTEGIVEEVLRRMAQGEPLAHICRDEHMPHPSTWREWCRDDQTLNIAHMRARDDGYDAIGADVLDIVDGRKPVEGVPPDPARDKARADIRLKLLAKWDPRRYGDGLQLRHADADGDKMDKGALVSELLGLLNPR